MVKWYLGTMGFSYKDWNGVFYPAQLPSRDYLSFYSQIFNAVELDSTFYGTPRAEYVQRWAAVTPPNFKFCAKTPREITHDTPLVNAVGLMNAFLDTMRLLGDRLGPVLLQFPPDFASDQIDNLAVFLAQLPADVRYAIEFRHPSWHATATGELLQSHSVCWASAEYIHMPQRIYVTTDFIYMRWIGRHGVYDVDDHERVDMTARLQEWWEAIQGRLDEVDAFYGFFNNDYAGFAPATCNRFKAIAGIPVHSFEPPQQPSLL